MQPAARRGGITFATQVPNDVLPIQVDESLFAQALDGIISNAVKYSNPGAQVQICLEKTPDQNAHLFVTNQGKGLDPKEIEKVFDEPSAGRTVGIACWRRGRSVWRLGNSSYVL